jgi:hypothetical protein
VGLVRWVGSKGGPIFIRSVDPQKSVPPSSRPPSPSIGLFICFVFVSVAIFVLPILNMCPNFSVGVGFLFVLGYTAVRLWELEPVYGAREAGRKRIEPNMRGGCLGPVGWAKVVRGRVLEWIRFLS